MARTSKKKNREKMPVARRFHVGVYARLSVEGTERKNESIGIQIAMAKQYLKEHPEMELYGCYTDLGKTGTNFKREGFERMMQDVRKRHIDCVIVKDLSRFGRNHIEAGNYIQKIFPFMGVRFIALTDGIDTSKANSSTDEMALNLKNLINEMYARDIARKIKSSKQSCQEQGSYTGGVPPYGYQAEWTEGKKCLSVCPETAEIVKEIYEMYLSGKNMCQISRELYGRGIHRPGIYKKTGHVYQQEGEVLEQWGTGTIKFILTNPVYMDCLVQGTHKPLVSEDVFFRAASMFEKSAAKYCHRDSFSKKAYLEKDIYAGVLFCGDCGKRMARVANVKQSSSEHTARYYGYHCPYSGRLDGMQCPAKSIGKGILDKLVKTALHQEFALSDLRPGRLAKEYERQAEEQKKRTRKEIAQCGKRQERAKKRNSELYMEYHAGSLTLEEFQHMKQEQSIQEMERRKEELKHTLDSIDREIAEKGTFLRNLIGCNEKTKLASDVIDTLIHRIDVYAGHRVKITFGFCMDSLLAGGGKNGKNKADW